MHCNSREVNYSTSLILDKKWRKIRLANIVPIRFVLITLSVTAGGVVIARFIEAIPAQLTRR